MIAAIRIKGQIGLKKEVVETLYRLRLRKKYACVLIEPTKENIGMLEKLRNFIAYGEINEETKKELISKRGKKDKNGNLKPFFRLHPARGGMETKVHFPKGVLGNHGDKINELIRRML